MTDHLSRGFSSAVRELEQTWKDMENEIFKLKGYLIDCDGYKISLSDECDRLRQRLSAQSGWAEGETEATILENERERIVKALEAHKAGSPDLPYVDEDVVRGIDQAIAIVRGDV